MLIHFFKFWVCSIFLMKLLVRLILLFGEKKKKKFLSMEVAKELELEMVVGIHFSWQNIHSIVYI